MLTMEAKRTFADVVRSVIGDGRQRDIGKAAGISQTTVHDMLGGRVPSRVTLHKFVDGLGVPDATAAELFEAAGYTWSSARSQAFQDERLRIAQTVAEETARRMIDGQREVAIEVEAVDLLNAELDRLDRTYGTELSTEFQGGTSRLTVEKVRALIDTFEERLRERPS